MPPVKPSVRDHMREVPRTVDPTDTLSDCRRMFVESGAAQLPVLEQGRLVGVLEARDIDVLEDTSLVDLDELTVAEVMQRIPYTVSPDAGLSDVARNLAVRRVECAVVVDAAGQVIDLLPTSDVLEALAMRPSAPPGTKACLEGGKA